MTIRVVLADDQPLVRAGLRVLIADTDGIEVAGEAGTGAQAVQLARDTRPDVVVMDIRMPGMDGIEATRLITAGGQRPRVVILTTFDQDDYVYGALRAGASGFLVKDMALDDILAAIRIAAAGDALIAPGVTRRLIARFASMPSLAAQPPAPPPRHLSGVTEREREVLILVGRGMSTRRSPASCRSAPPPPKPTSPACSPNSAPATGSSSSSPLTRLAWSPSPPRTQARCPSECSGTPAAGRCLVLLHYLSTYPASLGDHEAVLFSPGAYTSAINAPTALCRLTPPRPRLPVMRRPACMYCTNNLTVTNYCCRSSGAVSRLCEHR